MRVAFRADASLQMGTGHIMRCVTLADALRRQGVKSHFLCRAHPGHMIDFIREKGHEVHTLATDDGATDADGPAHAAWLGTTQVSDAQASLDFLCEWRPDWLVVDHYALDHRWESEMYHYCKRLMVIDDLADRPHTCDLLADQNLGRVVIDYAERVPANCKVLAGPKFALLRPEFTRLRNYSLQRRQKPVLRKLLITMGGVDLNNATYQVLDALQLCTLVPGFQVTIVLGAFAPWLANVRKKAADLPCKVEVLVSVDDMARLMADADICIGAAGSTSWERCCMGLPTIVVVLADNQRQIAQNLEKAGAAVAIEQQQINKVLPKLLTPQMTPVNFWLAMSKAAAEVTDGNGVSAVIYQMEQQL